MGINWKIFSLIFFQKRNWNAFKQFKTKGKSHYHRCFSNWHMLSTFEWWKILALQELPRIFDPSHWRNRPQYCRSMRKTLNLDDINYSIGKWSIQSDDSWVEQKIWYWFETNSLAKISHSFLPDSDGWPERWNGGYFRNVNKQRVDFWQHLQQLL